MRKAVLCVFLSALLVMVCLPSDTSASIWPLIGTSDKLREAAKNPYTTPSDINRLIKAGADVNDSNYLGFTALMEAAQNSRYPEVIETLIQAGAEVNAKDKTGWTALMWAAQYNKNAGVIQALIDAGADVEAHDASQNVLSMAAACNTPEVVKALLKAGADVRTKNLDDSTALMFSAVNENPEVVKVLLNAGADVNAKDKNGITALINAAYLPNNHETAKALLNAGADVNAQNNEGVTALMNAASRAKNPELLTMLINAGADVNAKNNEGYGALSNAVLFNSDGEKIKILLQAGAQINSNVISNLKLNGNKKFRDLAAFFEYLSESNTTLSKALQYNITPEIISTLVDLGANINGKDKDGRTALMNAARLRKQPKIIKALLQAGADINITDSIFFGKSAKDYADDKTRHILEMIERSGKDILDIDLAGAILYDYKTEIINFLINFEDDKEKLTNALMLAAMKITDPDVITLIAKAGADVNAKSEEGRTALMYAAGRNKNPAVAQALINAGADVGIKDSFFFGKRAKDYAKDNPNPEMLKVFEGL